MRVDIRRVVFLKLSTYKGLRYQEELRCPKVAKPPQLLFTTLTHLIAVPLLYLPFAHRI